MGTYLMSSVIKYHTLDYMIICPGLGILAVVHLCTYIWAVYECHCPHRSKYITGTLALDMPLHTVSCGHGFFCQHYLVAKINFRWNWHSMVRLSETFMHSIEMNKNV